MSETLYVVMPVYNEEENIKSVIQEWYPILEYGGKNSRMVVADGGSNDNTLQILYKLQREYPKLKIISRPGTDHGTKVLLLYKYAIRKGADWIFQTDSDGQTLASEFLGFWKCRKRYDVVMGNRKKRGDGIIRKLIEDILRIYLKLFFGVMVPDANAPFRLMKSKIVNKYIGIMPDHFNLPNAILSACFSRYHEKVVYRTVTFKPRQGGKNYMNLRRILHIGLVSVKNFALIKKKMVKYEMNDRYKVEEI